MQLQDNGTPTTWIYLNFLCAKINPYIYIYIKKANYIYNFTGITVNG